MKARERVQVALNHQKPDRVPVDIGGFVTSFTYGAYQNFVRYFNITNPKAKTGNFKIMTDIDEEILERTHTDFRTLFFKPKTQDWKMTINEDATLKDRWGVVFRDVGDYYEMINHPLSGELTPDDIEKFDWPDFRDKTNYEGLAEEAKYLYKNTDYSLVGAMAVNVLERAQWQRGIQEQLIDMYTDEEFACALMDKTMQLSLDYLEKLFAAGWALY